MALPNLCEYMARDARRSCRRFGFCGFGCRHIDGRGRHTGGPFCCAGGVTGAVGGGRRAVGLVGSVGGHDRRVVGLVGSVGAPGRRVVGLVGHCIVGGSVIGGTGTGGIVVTRRVSRMPTTLLLPKKKKKMDGILKYCDFTHK